MSVSASGFAGGDRTRIELPQPQRELLKLLYGLHKPVVLVLLTGSALAIPWAAEKLPAILVGWYGGEQAGNAIADVLFGDANPAGRLPVTFYRATEDLPPFEDYDDGRAGPTGSSRVGRSIPSATDLATPRSPTTICRSSRRRWLPTVRRWCLST